MPDLTLPGIRSDSLLGYLKGLGLLAIVSRQDDPQAAGAWSPAGFALHSRHELGSLETFLLERWTPLPVVSPWNGGSGFYPKDNTDGIDAIEAADDPRLARMKTAIAVARSVLRTLGLTAKPDPRDEKPALVRALRAELPDDALEWLDAAVVEVDGELRYPPLLGSGGNDGRYDIANNYAQCVAEAFGLLGTSDRQATLRAALVGAPAALRPKLSLAHLRRDVSPVNSPAGEADALGNPWDLVLAVSGAVVLAPAAARRLAGDGTLVAPFTLRPTAAGYGSAVAGEKGRAELWMPTWSRPARLAEVRAMLREGRVQVGRRDAVTGLDAARAVGELGVARGIRSFQRFAILERAGQSNVSIPAGRIEVRERPAAGALGTLDPWLGRIVRYGAGDVPRGPREAIRALERAVFALAAEGSAAAAERVVAALGDVEAACTRSGVEQVRPLRGASAAPWLDLLDTASAETRLAIAYASLADRRGAAPSTAPAPSTALTLRAALVGQDRAYAPAAGWAPPSEAPIVRRLAAIHERRLRDGAGGFTRGIPARLEDLERFVAGALDERRLAALLRGLLVLDWSAVGWRPDPGPVVVRDPLLAHLLLAFHDPRADDEVRIVPRADWVTRLRAGRVRDVVDAVHLRLRLGELAPIATPADLVASAAAADGERLAAALLARPATATLHAVIGAITTYDEREVPVAP